MRISALSQPRYRSFVLLPKPCSVSFHLFDLGGTSRVKCNSNASNKRSPRDHMLNIGSDHCTMHPLNELSTPSCVKSLRHPWVPSGNPAETSIQIEQHRRQP